MRRLDGRVGVVTGASSGIGRAVCRELVRRGARVAMLARRTERLAELENELGEAALAVPADVTRDEDIERAVTQVRARFSRIDIVLANAGFGVGRPVERLGVEDFRRQFETNVFGVLRTLYSTIEDLRKSRGVFAITGSVSGHLAAPGSVAYAMSKFAVRALAEGLRAELAPSGIAVVLLSPGFVVSEIGKVDRHGRYRPDFKDGVPAWLRMPTDEAAAKIVTAIARRRREVVITAHGKVAVFLARHFPRTTAFLLARAVPRRRPEE
ncbi:MAG: SDR family NAD(P)-dependent oxidoreductase [Acidobacteriota bacterium]